MSALFHNDFDRLLRERIQSHGGVDVKRFKESKDFIRESEMERNRKRFARFRKLHPEINRENQRKYREAHKSEISERMKAYRESHKEQIRSRFKEWYEKNRESCLEHQVKWRKSLHWRNRLTIMSAQMSVYSLWYTEKAVHTTALAKGRSETCIGFPLRKAPCPFWAVNISPVRGT